MLKLYKNLFVHYSVLLIILCFLLGGNYNSPGLVLLSVILHECGHLIFLLCCGGKPHKIVFHAFGISISTDAYKLSSVKMLLTALGGPALSFALAGLFYFLFPPLFPVNLCIGAINMLPVLPLDGGRTVQIFFVKALGRKSARILMQFMGFAFGIIALPAGIYLFFISGFNISLALLGFFIIAESFNTPLLPPAVFVNHKAVLGEIYLIPQSMTLRDAAEILPADSLGAVIDEQGSVLRLVTSKGLYNQLAQPHNNY